MRNVAVVLPALLLALAAAPAHASVGIVVTAPDLALAEHQQLISIPVFMQPNSSQCISEDPDGVDNCPTAFESSVGSTFPGATVCVGFSSSGGCLTTVPRLVTRFFVAVDDDVPVATSFTVGISGRGTNGVASSGQARVEVRVAAPLLAVPATARAQDVPPATIGVERAGGETATILGLVGQAGISGSFVGSSSATARNLQLAIGDGVAPGRHDLLVTALTSLRDPVYPIEVEVPFCLDLATAQLAVQRGRFASTSASIARLAGFADAVSFAIEKVPSGGTFPTFPLPPTVNASISAGGVITISVPAFSTTGAVDFKVKATSGGLTRTRILHVNVL